MTKLSRQLVMCRLILRGSRGLHIVCVNGMSHVTNIALQVYQISRVVIGKFHQQSKLYLIQNIYRHCPCEYKMLPLGTYYYCENKWHDKIMWDVYIMFFWSCTTKGLITRDDLIKITTYFFLFSMCFKIWISKLNLLFRKIDANRM